MEGRPERWTDDRLQRIIGNLLRTGVTSSAAIVFAGGAIYLLRNGHAAARYGVFRGEPGELLSLSGIWHGAISLQGRGVIQLGLVLLIATPVARVAFSVMAFALRGDTLYVVVTLAVLAVLMLSLIGVHV